MRLDVGRLEAKTQFIEKNLIILKPLANLSQEEFLADVRNVYTAIHALQISIEALLDAFGHIIARLHLGAPTNDREILEVMLERGLIPKAHFERYFQMYKFRNKVVHGYADVDPAAVYQIVHNDLGDFVLFFEDLRQIIESERAKDNNTNTKKTNSER